ncbi:TonB-dependent receptor [Chitinophaga sp.]|uniref:TonB-dependent receptor n=1 Tax=Chitinophaga sp. TaxID=1869181 RepID=UPI0031D42637
MIQFHKKGISGLTLVMIILSCLAQAQNKIPDRYRVSLVNKSISLKEFFKAVQKQTNLTVYYSDERINVADKISVNFADTPLETVMAQLRRERSLTYEYNNGTLLIRPVKLEDVPAPGPGATQKAGQITISGRVTNDQGLALIGVTVVVKGLAIGATTDSLGEYQIAVPENSPVLVFSYVGYDPQEVTLKNQKIVNVVLNLHRSEMNEVIVVGYGRQKKITTIGAQSTITTEELKQPVANLSTLVAGRVAGIIGVQRSGEPGFDNSEIYIRGISTFTSSSPLVLVDGVERAFNNIDPEDIASFTILKDASATAVYGVRGANGVIVIETKKGRLGKTIINAQVDQGWTSFTRLPKFADGITYLEISNEAYKNSNPSDPLPRYSQERIQKTADKSDPDLYPDVDWFNAIFKKYGNNRRVRVNANGGSDKAQYYLSIGYYDETGMFKTDELAKYNSSIRFNRYNFTSNLTLNVTKTTRVDFGASGWISNGNYPGNATGSIFNAAYVMPPVSIPVKYSNGYFSQVRTGDMANPYTMLTQSGYATRFNSQLWSNIRVTQNLDFLTRGLSITGMYSFDNNNGHYISRSKSVNGYFATGRDGQGNLQFIQTQIGTDFLGYNRDNGGSRQFYLESAINYNRNFGKHQVTGMVLYNQSDRIDAFAGDFISSIPYRYLGVAARATYAYDTRYLAEVNFGYNGSETFTPDRRFGFFPSFGIGWVASQEKFLESVKNAVSFLKFRFSYGEVGNSNIGGRRFGYIATVANVGGYDYGRNNINNTINGLNFGDYAVDVSWERAKKYNLGIEFKTWEDAISLTADFFREKRRGIFRPRGDVPQFVGIINLPQANLGAVNNKGIDATLEINKQVGRNFKLGFRGNITWNRAIVIDDANAPWPYPWQQRIGRKLGQRFGYIDEGLFQSDEEVAHSAFQPGTNKPGDIRYRDMNGDGKIDSYDQAPIGYGSMPEIVYGFGPTLSWKNWSIAAWFKGIGKVDVSLYGDGFRPFTYGGERGNLLAEINDHWTPDNKNPRPFYPRLTYGADNMNYEGSTWWMKNGAFLRLQTLQLNYELSKNRWLSNLGISTLDIYFMGYNLATFSGFKLWDVELGDGRGAQYPLLKTYNFGLRCNF